MAGKFPDIVIYVSDKSGKHNFSKSSIALWLSDKTDNNGNHFWTGSLSADDKGADRWVVAYKFVPKTRGSREDEAAAATPTSSKPKPEDDDVPF